MLVNALRNCFFAKRIGGPGLEEAQKTDSPMYIEADDGTKLRVFIVSAQKEEKYWTFHGTTCGKQLSGAYFLSKISPKHFLHDFAIIRFKEDGE